MPLDPTTEAVLAELAAAAGSSATSTRTTRTAASCAGAPAASSSPSTTGSRRSIPYPAAPEDCRAAKVWAAAHAEALGGRPGPVTLGGDSAGGKLAAVVALLARGRGRSS